MMVEEVIIAHLRSRGINASTKALPNSTDPKVLITRLGGDMNYGSSSSVWVRTGYQSVVLGFTVLDQTEVKAFGICEKIFTELENLRVENNMFYNIEISSPSSVLLENINGYTFQAILLLEG